MPPGSIIFHKDFLFADGTSKDKYLVVLGGNASSVITAKTTSKGSRYRLDHGCQAGNRFAAFLLTVGCCCLPKSTWICFSEFYEIPVAVLTARRAAGEVFHFGQLAPELTRDVQACAATCDDISGSHEVLVRSSMA